MRTPLVEGNLCWPIASWRPRAVESLLLGAPVHSRGPPQGPRLGLRGTEVGILPRLALTVYLPCSGLQAASPRLLVSCLLGGFSQWGLPHRGKGRSQGTWPSPSAPRSCIPSSRDSSLSGAPAAPGGDGQWEQLPVRGLCLNLSSLPVWLLGNATSVPNSLN